MFSTEFEKAVLWVGTSVLMAALLLVAMLLGLFLLQAFGRWRREKVLACWRPLFMACLYEDVASWPRLPGSAVTGVLELWRHLHDSLGVEQKCLLEQAAIKAGLPSLAAGLLRSASVKSRAWVQRYLAV